MNRGRKRNEPTLLEQLRELELLDEGEMVDIPDLEIDDLIEKNTLSVIVRYLNPHAHKVGGLVKALPPIWGMEDIVRGRGVGENRVQFIFNSESDLHHVLTKGPWFVNGWMVSLDQWSPNPRPNFIQRITFWIRVKGLPIHMVKKEIVESLLGPMGKVGLVELHAKNSDSLEYVRAQVSINTEEPLQFRRTSRFRSGTTISTELEYEKMLKVCYTCKRLTHDQSRCLLQSNTSQEVLEGRQLQSKEQNLRSKLLEKELKGKEVLQQNPGRGVAIRSNQSGGLREGEDIKLAKVEKIRGEGNGWPPPLKWCGSRKMAEEQQGHLVALKNLQQI